MDHVPFRKIIPILKKAHQRSCDLVDVCFLFTWVLFGLVVPEGKGKSLQELLALSSWVPSLPEGCKHVALFHPLGVGLSGEWRWKRSGESRRSGKASA